VICCNPQSPFFLSLIEPRVNKYELMQAAEFWLVDSSGETWINEIGPLLWPAYAIRHLQLNSAHCTNLDHNNTIGRWPSPIGRKPSGLNMSNCMYAVHKRPPTSHDMQNCVTRRQRFVRFGSLFYIGRMSP